MAQPQPEAGVVDPEDPSRVPAVRVSATGGGGTGDAQPVAGTGARPLWRNRDYMAWWTGTTVSSLGSKLSGIAFPLLILYDTGSVAKAGVIAACTNVGQLVTMLIGGVLADRVSRKALLVCVPLVEAAAVGAVVALVLTHHVSILVLGSIAAVQGLANGLGFGALSPSLKRIVPAGQFPTASAAQQGRDQVAGLVGPSLGAFLFVTARWAPFLGDALSFLAAAFGSALVRADLGPDKDERAVRREPLRSQFAESFRFVRSHAYMRFMTAWVPLVNGLFVGLMLLTLALIRHRGGGPVATGAVNSIAALGGLTGALCTPWLVRRVRGRTITVIMSWIMAGGVFAVAYLPRTWEIGAAYALIMIMIPPINAVLDSYEIKIIPDELLGRVSALLYFVANALRWIGPIVGGVLADVFGPVMAIAVVGAAFVVLAAWVQSTKALYVLDTGGARS
jgi:MFS family permease